MHDATAACQRSLQGVPRNEWGKGRTGTYTSYTSYKRQGGMAYQSRGSWSRSSRSTPRLGKPITWERGTGGMQETAKAGEPEILNLGSASHWKAGCGESRMSSLEGGS